MSEQETLFDFPCDFPIKAMGKASKDFDRIVVEIVNRHVEELPEGAVTVRDSKGGKYLAVTVTIQATSREQLDAIYMDLTACEHVVMAL